MQGYFDMAPFHYKVVAVQTGAAAGTGVLAFPGPFGMVFTDPAAILAQ